MDLPDREPNVVFRLTLATLVIVILVGIACIGVTVTEQLRERDAWANITSEAFSTNTAVETAIYATMTANSWTRTPTPKLK